jgi:hypothetical protein
MLGATKVKRRSTHHKRCSYAGKLVVHTRVLDVANGEQIPAIGNIHSMLEVYNKIATREKEAKEREEFNKTRCRRLRAEAKAQAKLAASM